ncbi:nucleoid-associated protein [Azotosporobacter soli]|uniref:nucleoid-associated protein n=1 Tax=Azotosporobacter soli TaxID=3055040 RepID=UPI0031FE6694
MLNIAKAKLTALSIHRVGNRLRDEGMTLSNQPYQIEDAELEEALLKYFLSSFKTGALHRFDHPADLHLNEIYMYICDMFIREESFHQQSQHICRYLYDVSDHPQIKGGEVYIARFSDCEIDGQLVDAIGIFKTEHKATYLQVEERGARFSLDCHKGINIKRLDKGCLIFNLDSMAGFRVMAVDGISKNDEAQYWKERFLRIQPVADEYFHTLNCLEICRDFAEQACVQGKADRKDQAVLMSSAIGYFGRSETFNIDEFAAEVIREPERIQEFKEHRELYQMNQGAPSVDSFTVSAPALRNAKRRYRNQIKLDTAMEIRLSEGTEGLEDNLERGYDEARGMYYYKLFFHNEQ